MKLSEMNAHQKAMFRLMDEVTCDYIGGFENSLSDNPVESEEYQAAYRFLNQGHDKLAEFFYSHIMSDCKVGTNATHLRFAGSQFLKERIEKRLIKFGY